MLLWQNSTYPGVRTKEEKFPKYIIHKCLKNGQGTGEVKGEVLVMA